MKATLSVKAVLLAGMIVVPLVFTAILLGLFWNFADSASQSQTRILMAQLVNEIADRVEIFFDRAERAALLTHHLAESGLLATYRHEDVERFFFEQLRLNPEITGLFFGTLDGEFVFVTREAPGVPADGYFSRSIILFGNQRIGNATIRDRDFVPLGQPPLPEDEMFDPRMRPWFERALRTDDVVWTEPYVFYTSHRPGLSTSVVARRADGEVIGVVGADIGLTGVAEFLERLQARFAGNIALMTSGLDLIAAPGFVETGALDTDSLPALVSAGPPSLRAAAGLLSAAEEGQPGVHHHEVQADGHIQLTAIRAISGSVTPWIIGVTVPKSEVVGWFRQVGWATTVAALGLAAASCAAGLLFWQALNRRLVGLRARARAVAQGNYAEADVAVSRLAELRETEDAMVAMAVAIAKREGENRRLLQDVRRLAEAVHQVNEAILLSDADGTILYVNPALEALSGYASAELIGQVPLILLGTPGNRPAYETSTKMVQSGQQWRGEMELRHRSGDVLPIYLIASPVKSSRGITVNCTAIIHDLREQRRTEAALRIARDQAIQTSQAKTTFLASISHELRTPLNGIIGLSEMMAAELFGAIGHPRYREYIQDIRDAAGNLQDIIGNILELTSLDSGKVALVAERTPIGPLLDEVRRMNLPYAERRAIAIDVRYTPGVEAHVDRPKLRQMLTNLVANAIKYSPEGSTVHLMADLDDQGRLCLTVTDAGPGMDPNEVATALRPFERIHTDAQIATDSGLGLGLPMAHAIADLHGATFEVRSRPGAGTVVAIVFPGAANPMLAIPTGG